MYGFIHKAEYQICQGSKLKFDLIVDNICNTQNQQIAIENV